jgi:hypothetical protein
VSCVHRYDDEERKMKIYNYSIRKNSSNSSYLSSILVECRLLGMVRESQSEE